LHGLEVLALAIATGEARAAFSSEEGWAPLLGTRFGRAVINADEPQHAQDRRRWAGAFSPVQRARFLPAIDRLVSRRLQRWAAVPDFDVYPATRELAFAFLATTLGGFADDAALAGIQELFSAVLAPPVDDESVHDRHFRVAPLRDQLEAMLRDHIARHPRDANGVPSLIDHLRREDPTMTAEAMLAHLNLLLVTGHETSASLLAWLLYYASKPHWWEWLSKELDTVAQPEDVETLAMLESLPRLDAFVREVGRLNPPLLCAPRVCVDDVAIAGHRISVGSRVALSYGGANMSASVFSEPAAFRPQRWMDATTLRAATFGAGYRHCLGMSFAYMELKIVLARVIQHFEIEVIDGPDPVNAGFWAARPMGGPRLALRPRTVAHGIH
jgi:retinoid hydroxylase